MGEAQGTDGPDEILTDSILTRAHPELSFGCRLARKRFTTGCQVVRRGQTFVEKKPLRDPVLGRGVKMLVGLLGDVEKDSDAGQGAKVGGTTQVSSKGGSSSA